MVVDYKKWAMVGGGVGLISYGLAWAYKFMFGAGGAGTLTFSTLDVNVRQQIVSGVDTSLGTNLLNVFGGNFSNIAGGAVGALLMAVVGSILLVLVGRFVYEYVPWGKEQNIRLIAVLLYGSVVGGWIVSFMSGTGGVKIPALNAIIAMTIYFFIVAVVYNFASKTQAAGKYFPIPQ